MWKAEKMAQQEKERQILDKEVRQATAVGTPLYAPPRIRQHSQSPNSISTTPPQVMRTGLCTQAVTLVPPARPAGGRDPSQGADGLAAAGQRAAVGADGPHEELPIGTAVLRSRPCALPAPSYHHGVMAEGGGARGGMRGQQSGRYCHLD
jgi:hypothetical protein